MTKLHYLPATTLAQMIRTKEISSVELTTTYLERINEINPSLNAVTELKPEWTLEQAKKADQALAKNQPVGPLHGLPITIKDSTMVKDFLCTTGTAGWKHFVAKEDAKCVSLLKSAGAVILGITNTPELLSAFETVNDLYGQTNNPYDLSRSPGGSSGGEACIIAAGGSALGLGSDGGGSIRVPSHFSGVAGIKPTQGLLSRVGIHLEGHGLGWIDPYGTLGPIARYVDDLKLTLPLLAQYDIRDPYCVPVPYSTSKQIDLTSLKVAFYTDNGLATPQDEIQMVIREAAKALSQKGMQVIEDRPNDVKDAYELLWQHYFEDSDGGDLRHQIVANLGTSKISPLHQEFFDQSKKNIKTLPELLKSLERIGRYKLNMNAFIEQYDVIICPPCATTAKQHGTSFKHIKDYSYTMAYNLTGWPAAVVRCGTDKSGLPIGVQVVARPWHDHIALAVAKYLEEIFGGWQAPKI